MVTLKKWQLAVGLIAAILSGGGLAAQALAVEVVESGFCIKVEGRDCAERVANDAKITLAELERDDEGHPVLHFQSVVTVETGDRFVHSWERGKGATDTLPRVYSTQPLPEEDRTTVGGFRLGELGDPLNVVIEANVSSPKYRAVSTRFVGGPGRYAAKVVDTKGGDFPGSALYIVEVVE